MSAETMAKQVLDTEAPGFHQSVLDGDIATLGEKVQSWVKRELDAIAPESMRIRKGVTEIGTLLDTMEFVMNGFSLKGDKALGEKFKALHSQAMRMGVSAPDINSRIDSLLAQFQSARERHYSRGVTFLPLSDSDPSGMIVPEFKKRFSAKDTKFQIDNLGIHQKSHWDENLEEKEWIDAFGRSLAYRIFNDAGSNSDTRALSVGQDFLHTVDSFLARRGWNQQDAYVAFYSIVVPYIGAAIFTKLSERLGRPPNDFEHFSEIQNNPLSAAVYYHLNHLIGKYLDAHIQKNGWKARFTRSERPSELFLLRDIALLSGKLYPFSEKSKNSL